MPSGEIIFALLRDTKVLGSIMQFTPPQIAASQSPGIKQKHSHVETSKMIDRNILIIYKLMD